MKLSSHIFSSRQAMEYPPILDYEPTLAARFLTIADLKKYYPIVKATFTDIGSGEHPRHEILYDTIMQSGEAFRWFVTFLKEMELALHLPHKTKKFPFEKVPEDTGEEVQFQQPFNVYNHSKGQYITSIKKRNLKDADPIHNYRIQYVLSQYDMEEFQEDEYPTWYAIKSTTILEQYNERTNKRVKIDFMNGEFQYYIAGASDNWQPILDVPLEMDDIVSALLIRNMDV